MPADSTIVNHKSAKILHTLALGQHALIESTNRNTEAQLDTQRMLGRMVGVGCWAGAVGRAGKICATGFAGFFTWGDVAGVCRHPAAN